jgi:hypothetical protein
VLIRALVDVLKVQDAKLILAGPMGTHFSEKLAKATSELKISDKVKCIGPVAHKRVPALIANATLCVAPSDIGRPSAGRALYPTKILEYMACKRAVVAPRSESVTMLIEEDHQASLFEPGNHDELSAKILELITDPRKRMNIANAGYELVRRECSASATRRMLKRSYLWLSSQDEWQERFQSDGSLAIPMSMSYAGGQNISGMNRTLEGQVEATGEMLHVSDETSAIHLDDVTMVEANPISDLTLEPESEEVHASAAAVGHRSLNSGARANAMVAGELSVTRATGLNASAKSHRAQPLVEVQGVSPSELETDKIPVLDRNERVSPQQAMRPQNEVKGPLVSSSSEPEQTIEEEQALDLDRKRS